MVKTLTNCNMNWKGTCQMNALMCRELGHHGRGFPTPAQILAAAETLQARCRLGYRASWVVELAQKFCDGEVDTPWFEDPTVATALVQKAVMAHKVRMRVVCVCGGGGLSHSRTICRAQCHVSCLVYMAITLVCLHRDLTQCIAVWEFNGRRDLVGLRRST